MKHVRLCIALAPWFVILAGCDTGTPSGPIKGVSQSAPKLEEFDERGNYTPYYASGEMETPRVKPVRTTLSGG